MSISFENGRGFLGDRHTTPGAHNKKLSGDNLRQGIVATGEYLSGEAILAPTVDSLAAELKVSKATLVHKVAGDRYRGLNGYETMLERVTGLTVMRKAALILCTEDTEIKPLAEHDMPQRPNCLTHEEITNTTEQINSLAANLPPDIRRNIGENLAQQ